MSEILGIEPSGAPEPPSPGVARDIERDAIELAIRDVWINGTIALAFAVGFGVMLFARLIPFRGPVELNDSFQPAQCALFAIYAGVSAWSNWRHYRRMAAAEAADRVADDVPIVPTQQHWLVNRSRQIIFTLLMLGLGYQWYRSRHADAGPIVFRNATISTSTGSLEENITIGVADGRIAFVGAANDPVPSRLSGARRIDALHAQISAATFDHSASSPLEGLRHIWVGQLYEGAPGDVVVTPVPQGRRRGGPGPTAREIFGAVVDGRYYPSSQLQQK